MSDNHMDELLNFDALATAEKVTGKSYKEDDATQAFGFAMFFEANERKRVALEARDDTHFRSSFVDTLRIYQSEGFGIVYETAFAARYEAVTERYVILWHPDGILATTESYNAETTNTNKIHFNWRATNPDDRWRLRASGRVQDGVLIGDIDVREGLRHNLSTLRELGSFVSPWVERPFLWLNNYSEKDEHESIRAQRIASLPEHVRAAIGPATR